jgi:hypothetical protein
MEIVFIPEDEAAFEDYEAELDDIEVIYLAGPIGLPKTKADRQQLNQRIAYSAFVQGALIQGSGYRVVINPYASCCYADNFTMDRELWIAQGVYLAGVVADAICMLPGWESSDGCQRELAAAAAAGKRCYMWDEDRGLVRLQGGRA